MTRVTIGKAIPTIFLSLFFVIALASVPETHAQNSNEQITKMVAQLDGMIERTVLLSAELERAVPSDRAALEYRLDEVSIRALSMIDEVSRQVAQLPEDDPLRIQLVDRFKAGLLGLEDALQERLEGLNNRIVEAEELTATLGGSDKVRAQAYSHNLRKLRARLYGAVVDVIDSRRVLELPTDSLEDPMRKLLVQQAERSVARLEQSAAALREVSRRLAADTANADLKGAVEQLNTTHTFYLGVLNTFVGLLERLDIDASPYRAVIVRESNIVSVGLFQKGVMSQMLEDSWASLKEMLAKRAPDLAIQVIIFLLILLVFRALSRAVSRVVEAALDRSKSDMSTLLHDVLVSISGGTVMVFGVLVALSQVGISLGPMLAGLGVAGFIVGFALQDTLGNFASGGMILIYRPYDVDDYVEVAGAAGLVKKMTLVSTTIVTIDNQTLVIPNSKIWGDVIKNVTHQRVRRVDMEFGIGYGDDIEKAERVLKSVVQEHDKILPKPEPIIVVNSLGDSSVNFAVRPWVRTEDYWSVYWDITKAVKLRFDQEGISIPFPQRDVHFYKEEA
jgi:small conductance mechanosensitive channel